MSLCFHGRHFNWTFLLANVQLPMLGADFFRHFRLVVDLAASQMLDTISMERFGPAATVEGSSLMVNIAAMPPVQRPLLGFLGYG